MSEDKRDDAPIGEEDFRNGQPPSGQGQQPSRRRGDYPEPPVGWRDAPSAGSGEEPSSRQDSSTPNAPQNQVRITGGDANAERFNSARTLITVAQILAIVSLFLGGILLSTIAVVVAIVGYRRLSSVLDCIADQRIKTSLKRAGIVAVAMSCIVLAINIATLVIMMPFITQIAQTGDYSSLFGGGPSSGGTGGTSTTWG